MGLYCYSSARSLFYLFVGIAGFTLGYLASISLLGPFGWPGLMSLSVSLAAIAVGLAFITRHLLVRLAGVVVGVLTAAVLYSLLGGLLTSMLGVSGSFLLLPCLILVGGAVGLLLSLRAFDLALMILSSLLGADAVAAALHTTLALPALLVTPVIVCLFLARPGASGRIFPAGRKRPPPILMSCAIDCRDMIYLHYATDAKDK